MTFRGVTATATSWSATSITATVPTSAMTGDVVVTVIGGTHRGRAHLHCDFHFFRPCDHGGNSYAGTGRDSVTITGNNFGSSGSVQFAGVTASTSSWAGGRPFVAYF